MSSEKCPEMDESYYWPIDPGYYYGPRLRPYPQRPSSRSSSNQLPLHEQSSSVAPAMRSPCTKKRSGSRVSISRPTRSGEPSSPMSSSAVQAEFIDLFPEEDLTMIEGTANTQEKHQDMATEDTTSKSEEVPATATKECEAMTVAPSPDNTTAVTTEVTADQGPGNTTAGNDIAEMTACSDPNSITAVEKNEEVTPNLENSNVDIAEITACSDPNSITAVEKNEEVTPNLENSNVAKSEEGPGNPEVENVTVFEETEEPEELDVESATAVEETEEVATEAASEDVIADEKPLGLIVCSNPEEVSSDVKPEKMTADPSPEERPALQNTEDVTAIPLPVEAPSPKPAIPAAANGAQVIASTWNLAELRLQYDDLEHHVSRAYQMAVRDSNLGWVQRYAALMRAQASELRPDHPAAAGARTGSADSQSLQHLMVEVKMAEATIRREHAAALSAKDGRRVGRMVAFWRSVRQQLDPIGTLYHRFKQLQERVYAGLPLPPVRNCRFYDRGPACMKKYDLERDALVMRMRAMRKQYLALELSVKLSPNPASHLLDKRNEAKRRLLELYYEFENFQSGDASMLAPRWQPEPPGWGGSWFPRSGPPQGPPPPSSGPSWQPWGVPNPAMLPQHGWNRGLPPMSRRGPVRKNVKLDPRRGQGHKRGSSTGRLMHCTGFKVKQEPTDVKGEHFSSVTIKQEPPN